MQRYQITLQWLMIRIAVIAPALAFLAAAEREGRASRCGTPLIQSAELLTALGLGYGIIRRLVRLVVFAIRHPS
jgi:hypothetical protein